MQIGELNTNMPKPRRETISPGSDRQFGVVVGGIFLLISLWPIMSGEGVRLVIAVPAILLIAAGLLIPSRLRPLNRAWHRLGLLLGKVMTPVIMGLVFALAIVPTALFFRLRKADLLAMKVDRNTDSYWIKRSDSVGSLKDQF